MEKKNVEKEKSELIADAISKIEKQYGKGSIIKLGDKEIEQIDVISTGCLTLDMALGVGGLPKGRIIEIYGPESSGKTTVALRLVRLRADWRHLSTPNTRLILSMRRNWA